MRLGLSILLGSALAVLGVCFYALRVEPAWLGVTRVTVPIAGLPQALNGLRIVQLSDLHLGHYTPLERLRRAVEMTNALRPDLVVLTGDYVLERAGAVDELAPVLATLKARYGVFAVLGNHDLWTNPRVVRAGLERAGVRVLVNAGASVSVGAGTLYLAGLDDLWSGRPDLNAALAARPPGAPVVLLVHEPGLAETFAQDGRVALQLSGHSHGGQVRLPWRGALVLPLLVGRNDQGLFHVQGMWLYTSRGIGVISPPVRFNCRPEIVELTLTTQDALGSKGLS